MLQNAYKNINNHDNETNKEKSFCICNKTSCINDYCSCHKKKQLCNENCICVDCKNNEIMENDNNYFSRSEREDNEKFEKINKLQKTYK